MELRKENVELAEKIRTFFAKEFSLDEEWLRVTERSRFYASGDKKASAWDIMLGKHPLFWWYAMEGERFFLETEEPTKRFYIDDGYSGRLFTAQEFFKKVEKKLDAPLLPDAVLEMTRLLREKVNNLEKQLFEVKNELFEVKNELEYRPDGPGYELAKQEFESLC